jgi:anti-sigma factor RsiW
MNCDECLPLLDVHADGELDPVRSAALEAHLKGCPSCAGRAAAIAARSAALRGSLPRYAASAQLRRDLHASLVREPRKSSPARLLPFPGGGRWGLAGLAASVAAALLAGYAWGSHGARSSAILGEAFSEHVRSLQENHLLDVVSTDRHTVKPWFAGKLDFSPPVVDMADIGFPLAGGRLDEIDGRMAASLVFHRRLHAINVFIWPGTSAPRGASEGGYSARGWTQGGLSFLAVSDIPAADLEAFAAALRRRTE